MKEGDFNPVLQTRRDEVALGIEEHPLASEDAGVLIAVTVTQHDHMARVRIRLADPQAALGAGVAQKGFSDGGAALEVFVGFVKRHHGEFANQSGLALVGQPDFFGEDIDREEIAEITRHTDDECPDSIASVSLNVGGDHAECFADITGLFGQVHRWVCQGPWR